MNATAASSHIVCPHCAAINRVPSERLGQQPNCGQCHKPLFTGRPVELSESTFAKNVSRNDIPVVVDFWAAWCGPCKMMAPAFEAAALRMEPRVRFAKLNTESAPTTAARFNIRSIPTLVLFRGGKEIARQPGAMGEQHILQWVESHL